MADENGAETVEQEDAPLGTEDADNSATEGQEQQNEGQGGEGKPAEGEGSQEAAKDDWRVAAAGGNKDVERLLKRFGSVNGVAKALLDAKTQLSKGQTSALGPLPKDATDEQKAEWRKARDIPDASDKYDIALKGVDWTDDDKAVLGSFTERAHAANMSNAQVKEALQWYADEQIARSQQNAVNAENLKKETEKALLAEYGADYGRNIELMRDFGVAQLGGQDAWDGFVGLQMADGTRLGDNPAFIKLIVDSALDRGDGMPFISGGGAGGMSDADLIKAHKELSSKANGNNAEAKEARRKMADPEYEKRIMAAYERQDRREQSRRNAA